MPGWMRGRASVAKKRANDLAVERVGAETETTRGTAGRRVRGEETARLTVSGENFDLFVPSGELVGDDGVEVVFLERPTRLVGEKIDVGFQFKPDGKGVGAPLALNHPEHFWHRGELELEPIGAVFRALNLVFG